MHKAEFVLIGKVLHKGAWGDGLRICMQMSYGATSKRLDVFVRPSAAKKAGLEMQVGLCIWVRGHATPTKDMRSGFYHTRLVAERWGPEYEVEEVGLGQPKAWKEG